MTTTVNSKEIRALLGFSKLPDGTVTSILHSTVTGLTAHADIYSNLPYPVADYGATVAAYEDSIPAALDGSKTAVAQKNNLRKAAIKMYIQIAHYVEANCNDDMATFLLSGFRALSTTKNMTPPVSDTMRKVVHGPNSGELAATLMKYPGATSSELRWAEVPAGGAPGAWTSRPVVGIKKATIISGLTPGTIYAFQVRALTKAGYTDWSDSVTLMCI